MSACSTQLLRDAGYTSVDLDHESAGGLRAASQEPLRPDPARPADARHGRVPGDGRPQDQRAGRLPAGARASPPSPATSCARCKPAPRISSASRSTWSKSRRASTTCWKCGCCTSNSRTTARLLEQTVRERTAELRESEARYRSLTELASDWYWEQDENGNFTKVSGPVLEMLGIQVDALAGDGSGHEPMRLERGGAGGVAGDALPPGSRSWISSSAASTPMARNNSFASAESRCSTSPAGSSVTGASASRLTAQKR